MVVWWPVRLEARVTVDVSRTVIWYHLMAGNFVAGKPPPDILVGWFRLNLLPDYRYIIPHRHTRTNMYIYICICIDRCPLHIPVAWDVSTKPIVSPFSRYFWLGVPQPRPPFRSLRLGPWRRSSNYILGRPVDPVGSPVMSLGNVMNMWCWSMLVNVGECWLMLVVTNINAMKSFNSLNIMAIDIGWWFDVGHTPWSTN